MLKFSYSLCAIIAILGFFSAFTGSLIGFRLLRFSKKIGLGAEGALSGFTAGLLIAFVCFKIIAEGFASGSFVVGTTGLVAGAAAAALMDALAISGLSLRSKGAFAVFLHHFSEGLALGGILADSFYEGLFLTAAIALHCIPEAIAVFLPLYNYDKRLKPIIPCALLSLPMAAGSILGAIIPRAEGFLSFSLTFAGGVMLYITCGEMLPESTRLMDKRLALSFAAAGFILGVVITA